MVLASVLLLARLQSTTPEDPATIMSRVARAVEGDSVASMSAAWRRTLSRSPTDRVATFGLATVAHLTYDHDAANRLFTQVVSNTRGAPDRLSVYARLGLGRELLERSRYERADSTFSRVIVDARAIGAVDADAEALIQLAQIRMRTVGAGAARALLDTAALRVAAVRRLPAGAPARSLPLAEERACIAAFIHIRLATPHALDSAMAGAALARRTGEHRFEGGCLFAAAQELERRGDFDHAIALLQTRVAPLLRRARDWQSLSAALQWVGYLELRSGRYSRARHDLLESVAEAEMSGDGAVLAWAHLGLGNIASDMGDLVTATSELRTSRALLAEQGDRWGLATVRGLEARVAETRGDLPEARRAYLETIDSVRAIGNGFAALERYRSLALLEQEAGRWDEAERWLREGDAIARGRDAPGWREERPVHEAANAMGRGDLKKADSLLSDKLRGWQADENRMMTFDMLTRHAEVLARRNDLAGTERRLAEASDAFASWRAEQGNDREFRVALLQARKVFGYSGAGVPYAIGALARGGRLAAAFKFTEERRARELATRIAERDAPATDSARASVAGATRSPPSVVSLDEAMRAMRDSTALIEFVTGRGAEPVTALVLQRSGALAVSLPALDSLAGDGRRLATLIASGTDPAELARRLGVAVLGPVLSRLSPSVVRLIVVPDGALHRLPFETLRASDGHRLVERFAVTIAPSATALVRLQLRTGTRGPSTLLAFGDPAYEDAHASATAPRAPTEALGRDYRAGFAAAGGLARLPNSRREAKNVAAYFTRADVRLGADATENALRSASLRTVSVMHFATHAIVDDQVVWRSALALAPGGGFDGFVGASDLAALDLHADLVVLSGCRTADGVVLTGEGVQGLTAPLLEAGARAVLATRWAIGDRDAGLMIDRFYAALSHGSTVGDALQRAQREAIAAGVNASVWGAFTLVGDPTVKLSLRALKG